MYVNSLENKSVLKISILAQMGSRFASRQEVALPPDRR
jgi:hypothetical protein